MDPSFEDLLLDRDLPSHRAPLGLPFLISSVDQVCAALGVVSTASAPPVGCSAAQRALERTRDLLRSMPPRGAFGAAAMSHVLDSVVSTLRALPAGSAAVVPICWCRPLGTAARASEYDELQNQLKSAIASGGVHDFAKCVVASASRRMAWWRRQREGGGGHGGGGGEEEEGLAASATRRRTRAWRRRRGEGGRRGGVGGIGGKEDE